MLSEAAIKVGGRGRRIHFTLNDDVAIEELEREIRSYLNSSDGFFRGAKVSVDVGKRLADSHEVAHLRRMLEVEYDLEVTELRTTTEKLECGLAQANGVRTVILPRETAPFRDRTLLVKGACRSGTVVHHEGDLMVLGDVNPGAEVSAAGDVVVFGSLLGIAAAGTGGAADAMVAALSLRPAQLRIGLHVSVALNEGKKRKNRGYNPEMAFLRGKELVVQPFNGHWPRIRGWEEA